ncbi:penicillin-binding protein activator, partial [Enterobacter hormaechei]
QVAQAANVSGNDDVVSPSQAEISDLTATGSRADGSGPTQDQAAPASVTGSAVPAQVAQAANVSGNDDVVSPSQAEISDLTATGSRA